MEPELVFLHGKGLPRCTAEIAKHFVGYRTIQLMTEGAIDLAYDQRTWRLEGAWMWPTFPGPFISYRRAKGCPWWNHRYAAVTGSLVARWVADGLFPSVPQRVQQPEALARHFDELYGVIGRGDRWGRRRGINLFERILLELADARAEPSPGQPWLSRVLDALADPAQGYDIARLARLCGMSVVTLRRRFRAATGQSLHAHAVSTRIAEARRLLAEGDRSIKDIAEQLGYRDVFFFSKQFRRHVGVPPAAFRASALS